MSDREDLIERAAKALYGHGPRPGELGDSRMRPLTKLGLGMALVVLAGAVWLAGSMWGLVMTVVETLRWLAGVA